MKKNAITNAAVALLAGAGKTDITPAAGTFINGDFFAHYAQYVHDNLFAKALVLEQGGTRIAIVVVDICVMPKEFLDGVRAAIRSGTGIPFGHILISSTHTHAAGSVASVYLAPADLGYAQKLHGLMVEAVQQAVQNMRPAKIAFGNLYAPRHVRCRRYFMKREYPAFNPVTGGTDELKTNPFGNGHLIEKPAAQTDPQVSYLAVMGTDNKWISILANYSLHYVGDWDNGTISADYFGEFSKHIQHILKADADFIAMMSNGTSGDINIWEFKPSGGNYPSENFKKSELIGQDIAEKLSQSLYEIKWDDSPVLKAAYEELELGLRKPSAAELEKAIKIVAETNFEHLQMNDEGLRSIYAREQILLNEFPDKLLFPLQAIRIGSGVIGGLGAEIFAETGLWLKQNSPVEKYFTIGLANGNCGYLPPLHELKRGGYETWRSRISMLEEGAELKVKDKQLELIKLCCKAE